MFMGSLAASKYTRITLGYLVNQLHWATQDASSAMSSPVIYNIRPFKALSNFLA